MTSEIDALIDGALHDLDTAHRLPALPGIPEPYPLQAEIINSPAKRKVICAGRRGGKTTMAALLAVRRFLDGQQVLLTSTSQDQADVFWQKAREWLAPLTASGACYKNETKRILEMGDGRIRVKTGRDADVLRGGDADLIVFDECALLDPEAWFAVGAPMLADRDGDAVFISTPRRRNWFFHLYQRAIGGDDRWQAWHFTTLANPHLSQDAVAELGADMTEDMYKQEILAEFLESDGAVFRKVRETAVLSRRNPYEGRFVFGVDWAQQTDYTVIVVMDAQTRQMVDVDRFNGIDWALQRGRLLSMYNMWKPYAIHAEANSIGGPNIEALQREGLPVRAFQTTAKSKPPLIEALVLGIERGDVRLLNDPVLIGELEAYERIVSPTTGYSRYSAPDGLHDDMVIATALAWHGVNWGQIRVVDNPFYEGVKSRAEMGIEKIQTSFGGFY